MILSNFNNKYIKVESDIIADVLANLSGYTSIVITANKNCCTLNSVTTLVTATIPTTDNKWYLDLTIPTGLNSLLQNLNIQNIFTNKIYDTIITPIDLAYVDSNCTTELCTIQTFNAHFNPLFKTQIDAWFTSKGITSNVVITFSGNTVIISSLPDGFIVYNTEYGLATPYAAIPGIYGFADNKVFINGDGLFITPQLFDKASTELLDGIYKVTVKSINTQKGYKSETNCAFIDVKTKCKVASLLQNLIIEANVKQSEGVSSITHLLHYSLVNGSNCGCNCDELCQVYSELCDILNRVDKSITNDCGCN